MSNFKSKLKMSFHSLNLLDRFKRVKNFIVDRLDCIDLKIDFLANKFGLVDQRIDCLSNNYNDLKQLLQSLTITPSVSSDSTELVQTNQCQLQKSLDNNSPLWPWSYKPEKIPSVLPSGRPWPKISIVTPTYNHGDYLEETIRSVILQGYPNLEYIVIDGGSTDNTSTILERYQADLTVCISEPDEGQTNALNKGFRYATGDILAWLNSDDQYLPDTLLQVAKAFDTFNCDLIVGGCQLIEDHCRSVLKTHRCSLPLGEVLSLDYESMLDFGEDWLAGKFFFQPEAFWTRRAWEISGAFLNENLNFGMDYDFWLRLARQKIIACHIPQELAIFRLHEKQKTIFSGKLSDYPEYMAISRYYQSLDSIEIPDRERQIIDFPKTDGNGEEKVDITATLPKDKFSERPLVFYSTANGDYYLPFDGTMGTVTRKIRSGKLESPEVIEVARQYIDTGSTIIDIGTRFGQSTSLFAKFTSDQGQVLAFEADAYLFHALQKTLAANHLYNVRPYLSQVGARTGVSPDNLDQSLELEEVQTIAIDDLNISNRVSLIKIGDGANAAEVLLGAVRTILKDQPVIILIDTDSKLWLDVLDVIGYGVEKQLSSCWILLKPDPAKIESLLMLTSNAIESNFIQPKLPVTNLCKFLKYKSEVDDCTTFLHRNGFASHNLICKDWDIAHIVSEIGDGNFLDMGSSDSYILKNLTLKNIKGDLYGIDFNDPDVPIPRVSYLKGDLMETGLPSQHFANISCLSVIEHEVDFDRFTSEVSRLLQPGGRLFVTFDYWEPKVIPPVRLYGLAWQPLDKQKVYQFIEACNRQSLHLVNEMDWTLGDPVIHYGYYAPHPLMKYTFGMVVFEKS